MGLVLKRAAAVAAIGLLIGVVLSLAASRALTTMVFGTETLDPVTYLLVPGTVLLVTLAAASVPAWRASRIDPLAVLREN
jgi:ABC-type antimicrobial peptide transport system permease subunit